MSDEDRPLAVSERITMTSPQVTERELDHIGKINADIRAGLARAATGRESVSDYELRRHMEKQDASERDAISYFENEGYAVPGDDDYDGDAW